MFKMLVKQMIEELKRPTSLCLKASLLDYRYPLKKQLCYPEPYRRKGLSISEGTLTCSWLGVLKSHLN